MDPASRRYVEAVAEVAAEVLESRLVGVYLHGSAVLGGFDPRRSDVDLLVVSKGRLGRAQKASIAQSLSEDALACPANGLELSVVTLDTAQSPSAKPAYELHVTTTPNDSKVIDGSDQDGDPDLVLHFAVCIAAGELAGPGLPPQEAFGAVPPALISAQLASELVWAAEHAPNEYAVLNACRAWKFAVDGTLVSKVEGGEWALSICTGQEDRTLIGSALALQRSTGTNALDQEAVRQFVSAARQQLQL